LLVIEGNGSLTEIGRSAIWNGEIENCVHQNHIIRVRCLEVDPDYIDLFWNSPVGSREIAELAVTSSGLYNLSVGKVSSFPVPIPPIEEQREIVRRASRLLELADDLIARIKLASHAVNRSSQAVLAKAFRGELLQADTDLPPVSKEA
jgi:type I restriction enzyme, S subunit